MAHIIPTDPFWMVVLEQLTSSPLNNMVFMIYYGVVVEVLAGCGMGKSSVCATAVPGHIPQRCCMRLGNISESTSKVYGIDQRLS
ncbi:hypothetical protein L1049_010607 [Liquidambar formosana]|uniref:Uncharacterized protein n=1 Tax=Liquidambar formosana TaxID=63359 RepID=A0AAP0N800_LIQFO